VYATEACVAAASCYPGNPDAFLANYYCRFYNFQGIKSANLPRVPSSIVDKMLVRGEFVDYQTYSQWYNGVVADVNPAAVKLIDPAFVKMSFDIILAWTGFCSNGEIPPKNFVDWFQWFSTVKGPATTCNLVPNCPISNYPYVMDLTVTCAKEQNAVSNPFSIKSCVAAALNWVDGIDSFLGAVTCRHNINFNGNLNPPASNNLPALSFNLPVANPPPYTEQNFIDFTYGSLSAIGSSFVRYPEPDDNFYWVTNRWAIITAWTNFCSAAVPQKNLADFLKYSHLPLTSTKCAASGCAPDPNASCDQIFAACTQSSSILTNPYADRNCVLAATCFQNGTKVFGFAISCALNAGARNPDPELYPRLTQAVFDTIGDGKTGKVSQQNYIDAFYGALSELYSPIWPDVNYVIGRWTVVKEWTNFPDGDVPYSNFADFLQYYQPS
jgi:hypothetical protein